MRLYLKGFLPEEIGRRMGHNIHSVERYLDDFVTVWMGLEDGFSPARLARNTRISEWVIKQYQALAEEYAKDPDYAPTFARLRERMGYLLKKGGRRRAVGQDDKQNEQRSEEGVPGRPAEVA